MSVTQESPLHRMVIADPRLDEMPTHVWNGEPEQRAEVERIFNEHMATNLFLAYSSSVTAEGAPAPPHNEIKEFDPEVEHITLTAKLVGG